MSANQKPSYTYIGIRFVVVMTNHPELFDLETYKWLARATITDLRISHWKYEYRNSDWHKDCIKILNNYKNKQKTTI